MARRITGSNKSKAAKEKENYGVTTGSDFTSQDIFNTTESNGTRTDYEYKKKRRNYFEDYYTTDTYDSKFFDKYDFNHGRGEESYTYDDYTTSAVSYDETGGRPKHFTAPLSKSEESVHSHGPRRRELPKRNRYGYHSLERRDYDYLSPEEYGRKQRSRLTRAPDQYNQYNVGDEDIEYIETGRRPHSTRRHMDYDNYYYTVPEKEYEYEKYFEMTRSREKNPDKHKRKEKPDGFFAKKSKKVSSPQKRGKAYQVYAYHGPNQHEGIFKIHTDFTEGTSQPSEIEVKTHEYPVLAFKDTNSANSGSDTVYLPVLVMDKTIDKSISANKNVPPEILTPAQLGNIQIFAANLNGQRNIFTEYTDISEKNKKITPSIEEKPEIPSGLRYAGSILGSIFDHAEFNTKSLKENISSNEQRNRKVNALSYQVIVDVDKNTANIPSVPNSNPFQYNQVGDPLHDDYPVTKDYIKVNDHSSEKLRSSMVGPDKPFGKRMSSSLRQSVKPLSFNKVSKNKGSREMRGSTVKMPVKKLSVTNNNHLVTNSHASTIRQSKEQKHNKSLERKQGSMAVASHLEQDRRSLEVKEACAITRLSTINENKLEEDQIPRISQTPATLRVSSEGRKSKIGSQLGTEQSQEIPVSRASATTDRKSGTQQKKLPSNTSKISSNSQKYRLSTNGTLQNLETLDHPLQKQATTISQEKTKQQTLARQDSQTLKKSPSTSPRRMSILRQSEIGSKGTPLTSTKQSDRSSTVTSKKRTSSIIANEELASKQRASLKNKEVVAKNDSKEILGSVAAPTNVKVQSKKDDINSLRSSRMSENVRIISENNNDKGKGITREPTYIPEEKAADVKDLTGSEPKRVKSNSSFRNIVSALVNFGRKPSRSSQKPNILVEPVSRQDTLTSGGKKRSIKEDEGLMRPSFIQSIEPTSTQYKKNNQLEKSATLKSTKSKTEIEDTNLIKQTSETPEVRKKSSRISMLFSRSQSQSKGKGKNKSRESGGTSRRWGIPRVRRSKAKTRDSSLATTREPMTSGGEVSDTERIEEDLCECYVQYILQARKYAHFFLGTTLHEQILNILKVLYNPV